jgi:hypothetical protein
MKTALILSLFLVGCTSTPPKQPTPFKAGKEVMTTMGCKILIIEAEEYNRANPSAPPKKADC